MLKNKKETTVVFSVFITALILRCLYLIFLKNNYFFYDHPSSDVLFYQRWAERIAYQNWFGNTVFYGMPLYPYFLATLKGLLFENTLLIRLAHIFLGSINCILVYFLAKRIFSTRTAILSSFLAAANFILIYYDWLMMPTTLIISLTLLILMALTYLGKTSSFKQWAYMGILIGIASLADGKFLLFFILMVLHLAVRYRQELMNIFLKIILPVSIGVFLVIGIVTARNLIIAKDLVLISAHSGINFYIGNNPKSKGIFYNPDFLRPYHEGHVNDPRIIAESVTRRRMKPSEVSEFWFNKALSFIKKSPKKYLTLLGKKLSAFFIEIEGASDIDLIFQREWKSKLDVNSLRVIFPMAILGIAAALKRKKRIAYLNLVIVSQLLFTLFFFLITRHRATILPVLLIFQSYAFFWVIDSFHKKEIIRLLAIPILLIGFFLLAPKHYEKENVDFLRFSKSGPIYDEMGQLKKAQAQYLKALKLQPFDTNTLYNLGNAYIKDGKFDTAIKCYRKAIEVNPNEVDSIYNMAYALEHSGRIEEAIRSYKQLIEIDPSSIDARFRVSRLLISENRCQEALRHLNSILSINPQYRKQISPFVEHCKQ